MPPMLQLAPLADERVRIERIARRLHETADTTERADLASELVRAVSRHEDIVERAVLPYMRAAVSAGELARQAQARERLRAAMTVVHERTSHIDPRNVHASDPEGFEQAIDEVLGCIEAHLPGEDRAVRSVIERAAAHDDDRQALERAVADAARHASERPHPARTAVGRFVTNANVKLDHAIEDVSTPQHPGAGTIDGQGADHGPG